MAEENGKIKKDWKKQLTSELYRIAFEKGTEQAFSGRYHNSHEQGMYKCRVCGSPLFSSQTKFDSGSGWPSFYQPAEKSAVETAPDNSYGMTRTEVVCSRCGAHLGHVFDDGPEPTGKRYCINSVCLRVEKE